MRPLLSQGLLGEMVKGRALHSNSRGAKETEFFQVEMGPDSKASYMVENEVGERDIWKQG